MTAAAPAPPDDLARLRKLPDLAVRSFGGSVVYANDESFAQREALIRPEPSTFQPRTFGVKGQVYDGWETRRRRDQGPDRHDFALVRLGAPGIVRAVVVDTAHFTGNYPPEISVEAAAVDGYPSVDELLAADWQPLVERSAVKGDSENPFVVTSPRRWTHIRLCIYPDGGVARLRVHGEVVPDPSMFAALGSVDLAALENGGRVIECSNLFYGSPDRLIAPGLARSMGEGWETARRRDDGNDWVLVRLAVPGAASVVELDTTWFIGNAPGWAAVSAFDEGAGAEPKWFSLLDRTRLQPDTRHRFPVTATPAATHVRLDIYPDGGMGRLRVWGRPTDEGIDALRQRWAETGST